MKYEYGVVSVKRIISNLIKSIDENFHINIRINFHTEYGFLDSFDLSKMRNLKLKDNLFILQYKDSDNVTIIDVDKICRIDFIDEQGIMDNLCEYCNSVKDE